MFRLATTRVDGVTVTVSEDCLAATLLRLIHFQRDIERSRAAQDPRILLISPMSGHFATLLRGTVETLLPDHEVYIIDWQDARNVSLTEGTFDLVTTSSTCAKCCVCSVETCTC